MVHVVGFLPFSSDEQAKFRVFERTADLLTFFYIGETQEILVDDKLGQWCATHFPNVTMGNDIRLASSATTIPKVILVLS